MELSRFFLALGIPQVGRKTAKTLAEYVTKTILHEMDHERAMHEDLKNPAQDINAMLSKTLE